MRHQAWAPRALARVSGRLPTGALARTRFAFAALALIVVGLTLPALAFASSASLPLRAAAVAATAWIGGRHLHLYRTGRTPLLLVPVDGVALTVLGLAVGAGPIVGVLFTGIYFRSLYGSRGHVAANAVAYLAAYGLANVLHSAADAVSPQDALSQLPGLVCTAVVMRLVATVLQAEERTRWRERRLRDVGTELVAARDHDDVYSAGVTASLSVLPDATRARVVLWRHHDGRFTAVAGVGDGADDVRGRTMTEADLPPGQAEVLQRREVVRILGGTPTAAHVLPFRQKRGGILIVPLHDQHGLIGTLVTSSDTALPADVEDALQAVGSQVALALESMDLIADALLRRSDERLAALIRNASDVVTVVGDDGVVTYQTPSMQRVFGHDPERLVGVELTGLVHPDDVAGTHGLLARAARLTDGTASGEWRFAHRDGSWRQVEVTASNLLEDPTVRGIVLTSRDVTERRGLERRLAHQAFHDSLTGLANRELFADRVEHALARGRPDSAAVLFVDLDDFKNVNDTLGHAAGDRLLTLVAKRLDEQVRPGDTTARLGGDEFGILLEEVGDAAGARACALRVLGALEAPFAVDDRRIAVNASIGIALARPEMRADELLRNADIAMYAAKQEGKNHHRTFEPAMFAETRDRVELHDDLTAALARDELRLHYQPVVELPGGKMLGVEALMRWQHPTRGLVPPGEFIPLAEGTGLIVPLGRWALAEGCRQLAAWRAASSAAEPLWLSVNLAAPQLRDPGLVAFVAATVAEHGLRPADVTLEITESAVMEDVEGAVSRLHELADLGVRLAIDDFGTGYSSLSCLQRFPLHTLKLDKAFTDQFAGEHQEESRLARAIVWLGQTLELEVVAEGVERPEQAERLQALGCRRAQGWLFARALPADELAERLERQTASASLRSSPAAPRAASALAVSLDVGPAARPVAR